MDEQPTPPIVARTYRCDRCGQLTMFDLAVLTASKLHSSPAAGEVAVKPNCSLCGAPLGEPTFRRIVPEEPPEAPRDRSWIEKATQQEGDTPANPAPVPELVPTPAAEPIPLEQATTKQPEPEPVL